MLIYHIFIRDLFYLISIFIISFYYEFFIIDAIFHIFILELIVRIYILFLGLFKVIINLEVLIFEILQFYDYFREAI
jgi:hypothetical protein